MISKSKSLLPILATSSNVEPNNVALVTASAISSILPPKLARICPVILPVSSNTFFKLTLTPTSL